MVVTNNEQQNVLEVADHHGLEDEVADHHGLEEEAAVVDHQKPSLLVMEEELQH